MSERYTLFEIEKLRDRFMLSKGVVAGVKRNYNISPTQLCPVIVQVDGKNEMQLMKWGFVAANAKDMNSVFRYKTYNAKSEGIFSKEAWNDSIRHRRCLVPANGFYAWKKSSDGKQPFHITPVDQDVCALAGIYSSWQKPDGETVGVFSIVTTESNSEMTTIQQRMPVIIQPEDEATWLDSSVESVSTLYKIMRPYPNGMLKLKPANPAVNSLKATGETLITPPKR